MRDPYEMKETYEQISDALIQALRTAGFINIGSDGDTIKLNTCELLDLTMNLTEQDVKTRLSKTFETVNGVTQPDVELESFTFAGPSTIWRIKFNYIVHV